MIIVSPPVWAWDIMGLTMRKDHKNISILKQRSFIVSSTTTLYLSHYSLRFMMTAAMMAAVTGIRELPGMAGAELHWSEVQE